MNHQTEHSAQEGKEGTSKGEQEKGELKEKRLNRQKVRNLRTLTMTGVLLVIVMGAIWGAGTGSLSAFGIRDIAAVCPLGFLETALAGRAIVPRLFVAFLVIVALTVLIGRVFCGWICPVPLVRRLLMPKADEAKKDVESESEKIFTANPQESCQASSEDGQPALSEAAAACGTEDAPAPKHSAASGLSVLGVTLASSAVFGFPVFCLVCPIGLIFASLFALTRLIQFNEPTLDLLIFPAIVILELVFLRKWCHKWCPLGALLSLLSRFNRRLVPEVDNSLCLEESRHTQCHLCQKTCSAGLDLKKQSGKSITKDCTKCGECGAICPARAIRFPWQKKR